MDTKGRNRLRLAATAAAAMSLFNAATRTARAGNQGSGTIVASGVTWTYANTGSGPATAPFVPCVGQTRAPRDAKARDARPKGTGTGCAMNVTSASITGQSDAYDGFFLLAVNGTQYRDPDGVLTVAGNTVTGSPATIAGLTVSGEYTFLATAPVVRAVYTFTNPTGAPITFTATVGHNVGSDSATAVQATSDGDAVVETVDAWSVTDDAVTGGDPAVLLSRFAQGAPTTVASSTVVFGPGEEDQIDVYAPITVPAGATRRLMLFSRVAPDSASLVAVAPTFSTLASAQAAGYLAGLSPAQIAETVNWSVGAGTAAPLGVPALDEWARWLLLAGVLVTATMVLSRRRD